MRLSDWLKEQARGAGLEEDFDAALDLLFCGPAPSRGRAARPLFSLECWPGFPAGRPRLYGQLQRRRLAGPGPSALSRGWGLRSAAGRAAAGRVALLLGDLPGALEALDGFRAGPAGLWRAQALARAGDQRAAQAFEPFCAGGAAAAWARAWRAVLAAGPRAAEPARAFELVLGSAPREARLLALAGAAGVSGALAEAERLAPDFIPARLLLAENDCRAGAPEAALRRLNAALALDPGCAWAQVTAGACLLRLGDRVGAGRRWRRAAALDPACVSAFRLDARDAPERRLWLGQVAFEEVDYRAAKAHFDAAVASDPGCAAARAYLGRHLHFQGRSKEALRCLDRAAELSPRCGWIHAWRGLALERAGAPRRALKAYDLAIRLAPRFVGSYAWRGRLRRRLRDLQGALADLDLAVELAGELDTGQASSYYERKQVLWSLGAAPEALADLRRAVRLNPKFSWATSHGRREIIEGSLAELDRACRERPGCSWLRAWKGHARLELGDWNGALQDLGQALRLDRRLAWAWAWKGRALAGLKKLRAAEAALSTAARLDPGYPHAFAWRAAARFSLGRRGAALADIGRAIELDGACAWAYGWRGAFHEAMGRPQAARADWDKALDLDPGYEKVRLLRARGLEGAEGLLPALGGFDPVESLLAARPADYSRGQGNSG